MARLAADNSPEQGLKRSAPNDDAWDKGNATHFLGKAPPLAKLGLSLPIHAKASFHTNR